MSAKMRGSQTAGENALSADGQYSMFCWCFKIFWFDKKD